MKNPGPVTSRLARFAVSAGILSMLPFPAAVQAEAALEEIIVTAQRRDQNLQDVPISVSVVSGSELSIRSENEIEALEKFVPGFRFAAGSSDVDRSVRIRGIGTSTYSRALDQSVGTVVDGVTTNSLAASLMDLNDVARVEVLRGPQGTLFGKNTSAGVLNVVTNRPTQTPEFGFGFGLADEDEIKWNGFASGPLAGDSLLGRISFYGTRRDAMISNIYEGGRDHNDRDEWGVRAKLEWAPTDQLDALLTVAHSERDHLCCVASPIALVPGGVAEIEGAPFGPENDRINSKDDATGSTEVDSYILELNYRVGDYTLTSITGFMDSYNVTDVRVFNTGQRSATIPNFGINDDEQWTQEIRITSPAGERFEYVAGLYYLNHEVVTYFERLIDYYAIGVAPAPGLMGSSVVQDTVTEIESVSAFANATWHASERLRVSAGTRFNDDKVEMEQLVDWLPGSFPLLDRPEATPGVVDAARSDSAWSWRFITEFDATDDAMVYASVARGYKGLGANTLASATLAIQSIIDPEIPTNYELGLKSQWLDGALRLNGALFHTKFDDFQAAATDVNRTTPGFFLTNAGRLETRGIELEADARFSNDFNVTAALAYQEAEYDDYRGAQCYDGQTEAQGCVGGFQDLSGTALPNAPELTYTITGRYQLPWRVGSFSPYVFASWRWTDDINYGTANDPGLRADSYGITDLFVGFESDDGRYSFQVFAKNLFDEFYQHEVGRYPLTGIQLLHRLPYDYTRRLGVTAEVRF